MRAWERDYERENVITRARTRGRELEHESESTSAKS